jgi:hypothetical protein
MTAAELNALNLDAAAETAAYEALTNQATTTGLIFDHMAPLPPMPDYRGRSWEPAARHYRDLTPEEKAEQAN